MSQIDDKNGKGFVIATSLNEESDFIPLITDEDEDDLYNSEVPNTVPILPLRNTVLFPGVILPISVGRDKSIKLVRDSYKNQEVIGTVSQKDPDIDEPNFSDLNQVGTIAQVLRILEMPDGSTSIIIQGKNRFKMESMITDAPYITASVKVLKDKKPKKNDHEYEAIISSLKDLSLK
ncbi:MAG: LON peptidase substrate-binding domain-containing protein, partial [Bacteroidales bacterium]|nr:LON peptidase substrate-binding domain-containing protein [Bacteroidales bacterium]